jgi:microcystin-dependent protein
MSSFVNLLDIIYPIGSVYMSTNSTSPATLVGGTWTQVKDMFLLGAGSSYVAGSTGGEIEHTLIVDEMPSHTHLLHGCLDGTTASISNVGNRWEQNTNAIQKTWIWEGFIDPAGGDAAHNNMPPYYTVYIWHRTA